MINRSPAINRRRRLRPQISRYFVSYAPHRHNLWYGSVPLKRCDFGGRGTLLSAKQDCVFSDGDNHWATFPKIQSNRPTRTVFSCMARYLYGIIRLCFSHRMVICGCTVLVIHSIAGTLCQLKSLIAAPSVFRRARRPTEPYRA